MTAKVLEAVLGIASPSAKIDCDETAKGVARVAMRLCMPEPVIEMLCARDARLRAGLEAERGLQGHLELASCDCTLLFALRDVERQPSQTFRTLFMQETIWRGAIAPSFVVSYSHTVADIDRTFAAVHEVLRVYRRALEDSVERFLKGLL